MVGDLRDDWDARGDWGGRRCRGLDLVVGDLGDDLRDARLDDCDWDGLFGGDDLGYLLGFDDCCGDFGDDFGGVDGCDDGGWALFALGEDFGLDFGDGDFDLLYDCGWDLLDLGLVLDFGVILDLGLDLGLVLDLCLVFKLSLGLVLDFGDWLGDNIGDCLVLCDASRGGVDARGALLADSGGDWNCLGDWDRFLAGHGLVDCVLFNLGSLFDFRVGLVFDVRFCLGLVFDFRVCLCLVFDFCVRFCLVLGLCRSLVASCSLGLGVCFGLGGSFVLGLCVRCCLCMGLDTSE